MKWYVGLRASSPLVIFSLRSEVGKEDGGIVYEVSSGM